MRTRISRRSLVALTGAASGALIMSRDLGYAADTGPIRILLINPNTNQATTEMMVRIAQSTAPGNVEIIGATAQQGPSMITEPAALAASAPQVVEIGTARAKEVSGIIVSAFGDPSVNDLRRAVGIPV